MTILGGQERFMSISEYYQNMSAVLVCFDLSNRIAFEYLPTFVERQLRPAYPIALLVGMHFKPTLSPILILLSIIVFNFIEWEE